MALYLVGLDRKQIASVLGYRPEAAAVGIRRALTRLPEERELTWAQPDPEFAERLVTDIRSARRPVSRRRRRLLGIAAVVVAALATLAVFGALLLRSEDASRSGVLGTRTTICRNLPEALNAAFARHEREQGQLMRRQARQKRTVFRTLDARQRAAYEVRQIREQEALLTRQNRELSRLEAEQRRC